MIFRIVCSPCSSNKVELSNQGISRVCDDCCESLGLIVKGKRRSTLRAVNLPVMPANQSEKIITVKKFTLSDTLVSQIFTFLTSLDMLKVSLVSKKWSR